MPRRTGLDGLIRARSPAVSVERAVFRLSRSPPLFTEAGSSSRERSALLQRRFGCHVPGMTRAPSLGFGPASRHQRPESTFDEVPSPAFVPPAAFHTLSTVCSSSRLVGLFHPTATSRVSLQGFPPTSQSRRLVAVASLLAVGVELLPSLARWRRLPTRRPRGVCCLVIRNFLGEC